MKQIIKPEGRLVMKGFSIIDRYIIRKFLGTFFFAIALIMIIVVVFDLTENIDKLIDREAPLKAIVFDYYLNFIPYFVNLFSPLFTFIAVIFFTAKMASNTEIIAILSSGMSFRRMLLPYFLSSLLLVAMTFYLSNFLIPHTNITRLDFESQYLRRHHRHHSYNIHMQMSPGEYIYVESYNRQLDKGYLFTLEKLGNHGLEMKMTAESIEWDTTNNKWIISNVFYRRFDGIKESMDRIDRIDTILPISPADFKFNQRLIETMNYRQLRDFIAAERIKGIEGIEFYEVEKHRRIAFPFATIVLTMIGVALSSRKVRGGIGLHLAIGLLLSFSFILFLQVSTTFATNGNLSPFIAVWIPNIFYTILGIVLLKTAPK